MKNYKSFETPDFQNLSRDRGRRKKVSQAQCHCLGLNNWYNKISQVFEILFCYSKECFYKVRRNYVIYIQQIKKRSFLSKCFFLIFLKFTFLRKIIIFVTSLNSFRFLTLIRLVFLVTSEGGLVFQRENSRTLSGSRSIMSHRPIRAA